MSCVCSRVEEVAHTLSVIVFAALQHKICCSPSLRSSCSDLWRFCFILSFVRAPDMFLVGFSSSLLPNTLLLRSSLVSCGLEVNFRAISNASSCCRFGGESVRKLTFINFDCCGQSQEDLRNLIWLKGLIRFKKLNDWNYRNKSSHRLREKEESERIERS